MRETLLVVLLFGVVGCALFQPAEIKVDKGTLELLAKEWGYESAEEMLVKDYDRLKEELSSRYEASVVRIEKRIDDLGEESMVAVTKSPMEEGITRAAPFAMKGDYFGALFAFAPALLSLFRRGKPVEAV